MVKNNNNTTINNNLDEDRKCLACGKVHSGSDKSCPIIQDKIKKYLSTKNKNFLYGNIFLECIRHNVDFLQILNELNEYYEELKEQKSMDFWGNIFTDEFVIEYFATSIGCPSSYFFKPSKVTVSEYCKIIRSSCCIEGVSTNEFQNGLIASINVPMEITSYENSIPIVYSNITGNIPYKYYISKEKNTKNEWEYVLYMVMDSSGFHSNIKWNATFFYINGWRKGGAEIELARDKDGELKNIFETEYSISCDKYDCVGTVSYEDELFRKWVDKLLSLSIKKHMTWNQYENKYIAKYMNDEIVILKEENGNALYIFEENEFGYRFGDITYEEICDDNNPHMGFAEEVYRCKNGLVDNLVNIIESNIDNHANDDEYTFERKRITHADVLIKSNVLECRKEGHNIIPMIGIIELLTKENKQITYKAYVGYCEKCKHYYMFENEFDQMIKVGTPLCTVYHINDILNSKISSQFHYKSQSVLNAMGYTVSVAEDLPVSERRAILEKAVDSNLFQINDLLSFLNWLIKSREGQSKYTLAVQKWKDDMDYISKYNSKNRSSVKVDSITIKK